RASLDCARWQRRTLGLRESEDTRLRESRATWLRSLERRVHRLSRVGESIPPPFFWRGAVKVSKPLTRNDLWLNASPDPVLSSLGQRSATLGDGHPVPKRRFQQTTTINSPSSQTTMRHAG